MVCIFLMTYCQMSKLWSIRPLRSLGNNKGTGEHRAMRWRGCGSSVWGIMEAAVRGHGSQRGSNVYLQYVSHTLWRAAGHLKTHDIHAGGRCHTDVIYWQSGIKVGQTCQTPTQCRGMKKQTTIVMLVAYVGRISPAVRHTSGREGVMLIVLNDNSEIQ